MRSQAYYDDIIRLCRLDVKAVHWHYRAFLIVKNGEMETDTVLAIDTTKDFERGFTDNTVIEVRVTKAFYIESIYPFRDNLKMRIDRRQVTEKESGMKIENPLMRSHTYRAVLMDPVDYGNMSHGTSTPHSNQDENAATTFISVKFQLVELAVEQLMRKTIGGNFHGVPGVICQSILTETFSHLDIPEGIKMSGVDLFPPDEKEERHDIVIPHGTKVIDLPRFIQDNRFGIYHYGLGSYIMGEYWYLYPLYKYDRYNSDKTKLTISVIPRAKMMDNRRTYHVSKREVNIICGGEVGSHDSSNIQKTNTGDGVTYYDSNKLKHDAVVKEKDKVFINPTSAKKQILSTSRQDDLNTAPIQMDKLNTSLAKAMTTVAQKSAQVMSFTWEYSHPHLLAPGMATKVIYYKGETRYEVTGVLLKQVSLTQLEENMSLKRHITVSALVVLVDANQIKAIEDGKYQVENKGVQSGLLSKIVNWFS